MRLAHTLAAAALAAGLLPAAGRATETVSCAAADNSGALVEMNLGSGLPAGLPNWVRVSVGEGTWNTLALDAEATPAALYQAFDDGRMLSIDLADSPVEKVIVAIRILKAAEGDRIVRAGTLHVLGRSVHPILCDFGDQE
jgi:hypothetical protein